MSEKPRISKFAADLWKCEGRGIMVYGRSHIDAYKWWLDKLIRRKTQELINEWYGRAA